ncbi:MAG: hypothetical protein JSW59_12545 [Phycisphaerales bacterium]|nr:MAG: hypothetical protein JSW59_12545 [Phycisphaerales bacterium]
MAQERTEERAFGKSEVRTRLLFGVLLVTVIVVSLGTITNAAESETDMETTRREMKELTETVDELSAEVEKLKQAESEKSALDELDEVLGKLKLGGYGEVHVNFTQGSESDQIDFHRIVLYLGYDFADWIEFHSETELEHAFVSDDDGEISLEQAYVDFLLTGKFNVRAGRILTPIGIINKKHEPPTFNGVERPAFATSIIPTTWASDGVGIFGSLNPSLTYEAYVVGGLDGSGFSATSGIRGGRIKERPSLNEPAITGRLDYYPSQAIQNDSDQSLRLGASGYFGGLDNGDQGSNPGIDGEIGIVSADFEYSVCKFDFRGAIAHINIDGAKQIGKNVAEEILGWYLEGAYRWLPEEWKTGRLSKADATVFLRLDRYDTQHKMPSGVARNRSGDRTDWTLGTNFYLTSNLVLKADYQVRDDDSSSDPDDLFNLGIGWAF